MVRITGPRHCTAEKLLYLVLILVVLDDEEVSWVRVEHEGLGREEEAALNDARAVGDVANVDLDELTLDDLLE